MTLKKGVAATISYRLAYGKHPWPTEKQKEMSCWMLVREVWMGQTFLRGEAVAIFNFDSEGDAFKQFLLSGGEVRPE